MTTIVIGDNTGNTAGVDDAGLSQGAPGSPQGPYAGNYLAASATACGRMLYKFTGLPSGPVTVTSATLTLNNADSAGATTAVQARKLLSAWSEADATWDDRQTGVAWNTAGVIGGSDVDATVVATGTAPTSGGVTFDVTGAGFNSLVEGWINGTITNNGIIVSLVSDTSAGESYRLRTKESADGVRPYLTIVYTAGGGSSDPVRASTRFNTSRHTFGTRR